MKRDGFKVRISCDPNANREKLIAALSTLDEFQVTGRIKEQAPKGKSPYSKIYLELSDK